MTLFREKTKQRPMERVLTVPFNKLVHYDVNMQHVRTQEHVCLDVGEQMFVIVPEEAASKPSLVRICGTCEKRDFTAMASKSNGTFNCKTNETFNCKSNGTFNCKSNETFNFKSNGTFDCTTNETFNCKTNETFNCKCNGTFDCKTNETFELHN